MVLPSGLTSTSIQVPSSVLKAIFLVGPWAALTSHLGASSFSLSAASPDETVRANPNASANRCFNRMFQLQKNPRRAALRAAESQAPYPMRRASATCRKLAACSHGLVVRAGVRQDAALDDYGCWLLLKMIVLLAGFALRKRT